MGKRRNSIVDILSVIICVLIFAIPPAASALLFWYCTTLLVSTAWYMIFLEVALILSGGAITFIVGCLSAFAAFGLLIFLLDL